MVKPDFVRRAVTATLLVAASGAYALTPADLLQRYSESARQAAPGFAGFSAERGRVLFRATHGSDWSCSSCHTENPALPGRHARTGKAIAPLAPAANGERFTDAGEAEKWFKRNCRDVMGRECTPQEKGDVLAYLMQVGPRALR